MLVEQNTLMVEEREREIRQIVQSISDLNEIFRDLGAMIVEQVREFASSSVIFLPRYLVLLQTSLILHSCQEKNLNLLPQCMYVYVCLYAHT